MILVDAQDNEIGVCEKMEAHQRGLLHRAFSIFILNSRNELMLQQRALDKYHSGGLWTNTCCSHPRPGEELLNAANRRLNEEMGMRCSMKPIFSFIYKTQFENGLYEHELDHVFLGITDNTPIINSGEVHNWKYLSIQETENEVKERPEQFTPWFKICFDRFKSYL